MFMQSKSSPGNEGKNADGSSAATTTAAAISEPPPFDKNDGPGSVGYLFESLPKQTTPSAFNQALVDLFRKHPFVKELETLEFYNECDEAACSHRFEVYGFMPDTRRFGKWLQTGEGKKYRSIAGGGSDDGLYTLSEVRIRVERAEV